MNEKTKEQRDAEQQESLKQAEQYAKAHFAQKDQSKKVATIVPAQETKPTPSAVAAQKPKKV